MSGEFDLSHCGITVYDVQRNLAPATLYAEAIREDTQCDISDTGALIAFSGDKTGRSPKDKFTVRNALTDKNMYASVPVPKSNTRDQDGVAAGLTHAETVKSVSPPTIPAGRFTYSLPPDSFTALPSRPGTRGPVA